MADARADEDRQTTIDELYLPLVGETFEGTCVDEKSSEASIAPMKRKVIEVSDTDSNLVEKLDEIERRLEGLVWKGFIFHRRDGCYKIYADEESPIPGVGTSGVYRIESFNIFNITKLRSEYQWRLGVSITLHYEHDEHF